MSILVKGMDMPKNCRECFLFKSNMSGHWFCKAKRVAFGKEDAEWLPLATPNWCPLVEIKTPHGRLIDIDRVTRTIGYYSLSSGKTIKRRYYEDERIKNAPTIIEAEE